MKPLLIAIAIVLAIGCTGPEPVRDFPYDYDTDDYALGLEQGFGLRLT